MINLLLRFGALAVGLALTFAAWQSWGAGEPPTWSMFAPRTQAIVASSTVVEGRISTGTMRYEPVVTITTSDGVQDLAGIRPAFFSYDRQRSEEIAAAYPAGDTISVRWVGGVPMADRYDLFGTAHAVTITIFAAFFLILGAFLVVALRPRPTPKSAG